MDDYRFDLRATPGQIDGPVFDARVSPPSCGRDQTCLRIDLRIVVCYEFEFCYAEFPLACINPMFPNQQTSNENEGCNCDTFHWQSYLRKRGSGTANPGVERDTGASAFPGAMFFLYKKSQPKAAVSWLSDVTKVWGT
jgi:hypothetical protein